MLSARSGSIPVNSRNSSSFAVYNRSISFMTACFMVLVSCGRWGFTENDEVSTVDEDSVNSAEGRFGRDGSGLAAIVVD